MALIDTVPKTGVIIPPSVMTFPNGQIADYQMRDPGDNRGKLCLPFSYTWSAVLIAAQADGIRLASTGRYRSLARQTALFYERFQPTPWTGWKVRKFFRGQWWYLKRGMANAATPGTSNHGMGCADDVCELNDNGAIIGLTDRGLTWLRDNAVSLGIGLESHAERWHWHCRHQDHLTERSLNVLRFVGVPVPEWMGGGGEVVEQPPVQPPVEPEPPSNPDPGPGLPPVDLYNGVYGLTGYAISQMNPLPVLAFGDDRWDDPQHVMFVQSVIKFEASRFAAWYLAIYAEEWKQPAGAQRGMYLAATSNQARDMVIDGDYGPKTKSAVSWMQGAFQNERWEGKDGAIVSIPPMAVDGVVGPQTWPFIFMLSGKEFVAY